MHIQYNEARVLFTRVVLVFFSSAAAGETVKIELIQLIPPGTADIIPLVLLMLQIEDNVIGF